MATTQISKIQLRRGPTDDLPGRPVAGNPTLPTTGLDAGEIAFTTNTGQVFIGSDPQQVTAQRGRASFPYQNIEVLTENSIDALQAFFDGHFAVVETGFITSATLDLNDASNGNDWGTLSVPTGDVGTPTIPFVVSTASNFGLARLTYYLFDVDNNPLRTGVMTIVNASQALPPALTDEAESFATDGGLQFRAAAGSGGNQIVIQYRNLSSIVQIMRFHIERPSLSSSETYLSVSGSSVTSTSSAAAPNGTATTGTLTDAELSATTYLQSTSGPALLPTTLRQAVFGQVAHGSAGVTLTLPEVPLAGNMLVLLYTGSANLQSVPAGFLQVEASSSSSALVLDAWLQPVSTDAVLSYAVTTSGQNFDGSGNLVLLELQNCDSFYAYAPSVTATATSMATDALVVDTARSTPSAFTLFGWAADFMATSANNGFILAHNFAGSATTQGGALITRSAIDSGAAPMITVPAQATSPAAITLLAYPFKGINAGSNSVTGSTIAAATTTVVLPPTARQIAYFQIADVSVNPTLSFPNAPVAGNTLLLLMMGGGDYLSVAGFNVLFKSSDNTSLQSQDGSRWAFQGVVQSDDTNAYQVTCAHYNGIEDAVLLELQNVSSVYAVAANVGGTTIMTADALAADAQAAAKPDAYTMFHWIGSFEATSAQNGYALQHSYIGSTSTRGGAFVSQAGVANGSVPQVTTPQAAALNQGSPMQSAINVLVYPK